MDDRAFEAMVQRWQEYDARAEERHRRLIEQSKASERVFIAAFTEIDESLRENTARLDDMGEAIRANTRAVLAALDRIGPAPA